VFGTSSPGVLHLTGGEAVAVSFDELDIVSLDEISDADVLSSQSQEQLKKMMRETEMRSQGSSLLLILEIIVTFTTNYLTIVIFHG